MNLSIKKKLHDNVVPIFCDDRSGTAFFISGNTLLTARHNIVGYLEDERTPIIVSVDGQTLFCTAEPLGSAGEKIDVAVLTLPENNNLDKEGLNLLAAKLSSEMDLHMLGYPKELGGSIDPISLSLGFFGEGRHGDADLILYKKSDVSFFSYAGFSGSPVVNSSGSVIGITVIEESHNLRAISIIKVREALSLKDISYSTDDLIEDDSPIGLLLCKRYIDKAIRKAGRKYSPELHVPQHELDDVFAKFMDFDALEEYENLKSEIENWCAHFPKFCGISILDEEGRKKRIRDYIEEISYKLWPNRERLESNDKEELAHIREIYFTLIEKSKRSYLSKKKLFGLHGSAGTGKSHICHSIAEQFLSQGHHVYLCHGTDIDTNKLPDENLKRMFGVNDEILAQINERAEYSHKYVLFVIDALNEGAGFKYWSDNIIQLLEIAQTYSMFKFLVSERRITNSVCEALREKGHQDAIHTHGLYGFEDTDSAIERYAKAHKIKPEQLNHYNVEFSNPLMLSLFCQSIGKRSAIWSERDKPFTRQEIYKDYLTHRNIVISDRVDVDPHKNVTLSAIRDLSKYSIFNSYLFTIPREAAMRICNRISYRPDWSRNLLHHLIDENILHEMESWDEYEVQTLDFEFQNIGDVFRAESLLSLKWSDEKILKYLYGLLKTHNINIPNDNIANFMAAVIGIWNRNPIPLGFLDKVPSDILEEAMTYNGQSKNAIELLWKSKLSVMPIDFLFRNLHNLSIRFILDFHSYLSSLSMNERDFRSIRYFNRPFEIHGKSLDFGTVSSDINSESRYLFRLTWMTSSSHPDLRALAIRHIAKILYRHNSLLKHLLSLFISVNDPYVVSSVLCATYGYLLISQDAPLAGIASKIIYNSLYANEDKIPSNLHVRQWSMLILELSFSLNPTIDYISRIKLPLKSKYNPLTLDYTNIDEKTIFGETKGGKMLRYNLFQSDVLSSDFNRYIIGTNSNAYHRSFFKSEEEDLPLKDIEKMIAREVINLGWNDELGKIDTLGYSPTRHENSKERIGKKYLWIAYQNIMGGLSDNCYFKEDWWSARKPAIKGPWPWIVDGRSLFDPSLDNCNFLKPKCQV